MGTVIVLRRMTKALATALLMLLLALSGCSLSGDSEDPDRRSSPVDQRESSDSDSGDEKDEEDQADTVVGVPPAATKGTTRLGGEDAVADAAAVASVVFPAVSEATRPSAVVLVDSENWQAGVAASVLMARPLAAPLLLSDGDELPEATLQALERLDPKGADELEAAEVIAVGDGVPKPEDREVEAIGGGDPYALAAAVDQTYSAVRGEPSGNVIVTTGERAAFAMPAAAWAARNGDSVLFTKRDELPEATRKALREHDQPDIFILGPESAVGGGVEKELRKLGTVERVAADEPVENAVEFARYQSEDFGWGITAPGQNFTVASAGRPLDAAASAALATKGTFAPLLLTDSAGKLPPALEGYLLDVQPGYDANPNQSVFNRAYILGDASAVSLAAQGRLDEITELVPVQIEGGGGDRPPGPDDPGGGAGPRDDDPGGSGGGGSGSPGADAPGGGGPAGGGAGGGGSPGGGGGGGPNAPGGASPPSGGGGPGPPGGAP